MVVFKVALVLLFVGVGAFFIQPANYVPFAPNGFSGHLGGRLAGLLLVHRLRRGLHRRRGDPQPPAGHAPRDHRLADHLHRPVRGHRGGDDRAWCRPPSWAPATRWPTPCAGPAWASLATLMSLGAVIAVTAVLLVFQLGQTRIFMVMARDGLLPPALGPGAPALPHPGHRQPGDRPFVAWRPQLHHPLAGAGADQHRHPVRVRGRLGGGHRAAHPGSRPAAPVPLPGLPGHRRGLRSPFASG